MAKVNLSFGHLVRFGYTPEEIVRIVQALEAAGINVKLLIQGSDGMKLLKQLPTAHTQTVLRRRLQMVSLLGVGVLASLIAITVGWVGLFS